jgi:Flp pilus assembly protein TadD
MISAWFSVMMRAAIVARADGDRRAADGHGLKDRNGFSASTCCHAMSESFSAGGSGIEPLLVQARTHLEKGMATAARDLCLRALAADSAHAEAAFILGVALRANGEMPAACSAFLRASRSQPGWIAPRLALAQTFEVLGKPTDALSVLRQTVETFPDASEVWRQRGSLERKIGDNAAAEKSFRRYCGLNPRDPDGLNNLAVAVRAQGRVSEAIELYREALTLAPFSGLLHGNLGNALDALGRTADAEIHLRAAVTHDPTSVDARYNLGAHLIREERAAEGVALLAPLVELRPERWDIWTNLGVGLLALGQVAAAEAAYRAALRLRPDVPETHYDLAWLLLLSGRWREGWHEYEWRWRLPNFSTRRPQSAAPMWNGEARPGQTILLFSEQGLGDTLQFVRFAESVRERCARVVLSCPSGLTGLLATVVGVDEIIASGQPVPPHDAQCPLLSLPRIFDVTPQNLPDPDAYIRLPDAPPARLLLPGPPSRRKIGFVWAGSPDNKIDRRRSCEVRLFLDLMKEVEADFISLQVGERAAELKTFRPDNLLLDTNGVTRDMLETAYIVRQLDLVIGIDTAVMHLAGALGRPGWLLLPFSPDFRWLMGREDTPWYRSFRLFRQPVSGDWPGLFERLKPALTDWLHDSA